jgi:hypothetical protein
MAQLRDTRYEADCAACGRKIPAGSMAWVQKDRINNRWDRWHEGHGQDGRTQIAVTPMVPSPPAATSIGQGGSLAAGMTTGLRSPIETQPAAAFDSPELASRIFVQIAVWVPIDAVPLLLEAIEKARNGGH